MITSTTMIARKSLENESQLRKNNMKPSMARKVAMGIGFGILISACFAGITFGMIALFGFATAPIGILVLAGVSSVIMFAVGACAGVDIADQSKKIQNTNGCDVSKNLCAPVTERNRLFQTKKIAPLEYAVDTSPSLKVD